ncbi:GntR family transcriptional regulator [uncultured Microbacterium sp.]|uniref:GntR family transcriptional regulator n=1 Tax=uncultured Microbacterium sp. TaxID=191216 RepID=UPI0025E8A3C4|nr:GntR family transcriptional regulator [uncultured Microbacterium sp.]
MRASDRAYAALLDEIQRGVLAPGTVLGEVEQSTRLGVSRTPLREALARLQSDGLVAQASARVTVVTAVDADDIRALFEIRRALEVTTARLAAERGDRMLFAGLADRFAAASIEGEAARDDYYALIATFDAAVDDAARNDYLTQALRTVRTHLVRVRRLARYRPDRLAASVAEHRAIASAIADGDADLAAAATHLHLHASLRSILDALGDAAVNVDDISTERTPA